MSNRKILLLTGLLVLILGGFLYFKKVAECFAGSGAIALPQLTEVSMGTPIALPLRMLRISAPGCYKGHSSDSYKNVSCGYRLESSEDWILGKIVVTNDNETEYAVECQIPPLPSETAMRSLEYYFEYSAWERPPERKTGKLSIK